MSFVHLHCHSEFSLLDGANRIDDLIKRAQHYEMPALAITDHGNMHAAWDFQEKARKAGVKPIMGMEAYVAPGDRRTRGRPGPGQKPYYHLVLLARDLVGHSQALATADFYRLCWIGDGERDDPRLPERLRHYGLRAFALTVEADAVVSERWRALARCPEGSLGSAMARFYAERGFRLPGEVGGGNEALAQHDWVHVVAGYDTTPIGELEVTAFMAAASRSPGAMVGFLGAVSIYETGLLRSVVVGADYAHTLASPGGPERLAAAIARGRRCRVDPLLEVAYFALAAEPLVQIRRDWGLLDDMGASGLASGGQPS